MTRTSTTTDAPAALAIDGGEPLLATPVPFVSVRLEESDIDAAVAVLRSGMLAQGRHVAEFEERFAAMTGARHAVACANGTCALQLAYEPLVSPGDHVLCPAWSYIATASMLVARGATPVFVDADPETYLLDLDDAERAITPRTTAIAVTHLYGAPADLGAIERFAKTHGLRIIYDAAQAHFATWEGRGLGGSGDAVTYSFYPTKNMTTGEGGMVTTNDDGLAATLRVLRSHGETQKYLHETVGYNYRMTDVEAAIGVSQLDRIGELTARRREVASRLTERLARIEGLTPPAVAEGAEHAYHQYAVRLDPGVVPAGRDRFIEALRAEGVGVGVHYPRALTQQPCFRGPAAEGLRPCPVAERLASELFCLPVHPGVADEQVDQIGAALEKVVRGLAS